MVLIRHILRRLILLMVGLTCRLPWLGLRLLRRCLVFLLCFTWLQSRPCRRLVVNMLQGSHNLHLVVQCYSGVVTSVRWTLLFASSLCILVVANRRMWTLLAVLRRRVLSCLMFAVKQ